MTQHEQASQSAFGRAAHELAAATAALVEEHDTVGTITQLLASCARAVGAHAAGLMLRNRDTGHLELLAATSHRASELELYQLHSEQGPCIEASETGQTVTVYGADRIATAWPLLADVFTKNRFTGAHATPLRWRGRTLGAIGLFFVTSPAVDRRQPAHDVAKAFADIATLTVVHAGDVSLQQLFTQTQSALAERVIVEQAKGVIAYTDNVDMDAAFDKLLSLAHEAQRPVTHVATEVVSEASGPPME